MQDQEQKDHLAAAPEKARADEKLARQCAHILGQSSAAANALAELDRRRASGEDVEIVYARKLWLVGPSLR